MATAAPTRSTYRIGEVAAQVGLTERTIRYYEERDLARIAGGGEAEMLPSSFDALVGAPARCVAS